MPRLSLNKRWVEAVGGRTASLDVYHVKHFVHRANPTLTARRMGLCQDWWPWPDLNSVLTRCLIASLLWVLAHRGTRELKLDAFLML
jgi:hypothetical protein